MATFQDLIPPQSPQTGITPPTNLSVSETLGPPPAAPQAAIPDAPSSVPDLIPTAATTAANVSGAVDQSGSENLGVSANSTVKSQITDLLAKPSAYIQQARERGKRAGAERGLANSNLSVQSGEQAAIASALPIASQDAQTYAVQQQQRQAHLDKLKEAAQAGDTQAQLNYANAKAQAQLQDREHAQELIKASHQGK